ncbi:MAG: hypothetical protein ACRCTQ_03865 [Brevinemataceae bacterium]
MSDFSQEEKNVLHYLKSGSWAEAEHIAFDMDNSSENVPRDDVLKATRFWQKRTECFSYQNQSTGSVLFAEWENFVDFCKEYKISSYPIFLAVKSYIFKKIIDFLSRASRDLDNSDRNILVLLAYAFYEADMIDRSVETLEYVLGRFSDEDDYRVYTLLGDIYAEIYPENHPKRDLAVIMFNELFLKCMDTLDVDSIEYFEIHKLIQGIRGDLFPEREIKYWIPIYGYLYGGLTVRRNLRYEEYKKLQERISLLESEVRDQDKERLEIIIPKLLNVYFWIFDYYIYQMHTLGGASQIYRRVLELLALLYQIPGYEESAKKLGLCAERVLDMLLRSV